MWKHKRILHKAILSKKCSFVAVVITMLDGLAFQISGYIIGYSAKAAWNKNMHVDQGNKIEDLFMSLFNYSHQIFYKDAKILPWSKDSIFNKWFWEKKIEFYM